MRVSPNNSIPENVMTELLRPNCSRNVIAPSPASVKSQMDESNARFELARYRLSNWPTPSPPCNVSPPLGIGLPLAKSSVKKSSTPFSPCTVSDSMDAPGTRNKTMGPRCTIKFPSRSTTRFVKLPGRPLGGRFITASAVPSLGRIVTR